MIRTRQTAKDPEINVGSFADIAFLLIIFFILTTQLVKPAGREMELPTGSEDKSQQSESQLTIRLDPGEIRWGKKADRVGFDDLRLALEKENFPGKTEDREKIVILDSSDDVPYQEYYEVVMAITESGGVLALLEQEGKQKKKSE